jgi:CubicO group peptidase (beta-lactamase class C family)
MRRSLVVLTIAVLLILHVPLGAADDLLYARFGDYVESLRAQAGIPGLAAVIVGRNDIVWERAFGKRDVERSDPSRTDTPFHVDGVTQVFTAAIVLRCVEEGRLSLDSRVSEFKPSSPDADATIGQLLAHTSGAPENLVFDYRPERLAPLSLAIRRCTGD